MILKTKYYEKTFTLIPQPVYGLKFFRIDKVICNQ